MERRWWQFWKKKKTPLEAWLDDYDKWLDTMLALFRRFPDHSGLEGVRLSESEAVLLDRISDLYSEECREVMERMALSGLQLRRALERRRLASDTPVGCDYHRLP